MLRAMRSLFFALVLLLCAPPALAAEVFTVSGVRVDATAADAVAARDKAFAQGQRQAFAQLSKRLTGAAMKAPGGDVLASLIRDFEVEGERFSATRYVATYTYRFRPDATRAYLDAQGVGYSDVAGRPLLIVPFMQAPGGAMTLWARDNAWAQAWRRAEASGAGLVPLIVPLGDLRDAQAIDGARGLAYDPADLAQMVARYGAAEAAIVVAAPGGTGAEIYLYRTDDGAGAQYVHSLSVRGAEGPDLYDRGVAEVARALQSDWKAATAAQAGLGETTVLATAHITTLEDWARLDAALGRLAAGGVARAQLRELTTRRAVMALTFRGAATRLTAALERVGVALTEAATDPVALGGDPLTIAPAAPRYEVALR